MTSGTQENKLKEALKKTVILLFWLSLWEIASLIIDKEVYFPSFTSTVKALILLLNKSYFYKGVLFSMGRVCLGFALSMASGLILGLVCSFNSLFKNIISFIMAIVKSTPVASFIIIALIWFKSSNVPIFICFLMMLPIMYENVTEGITSIDKKLLEVVSIYKISKKDYITKVMLPSLKPFINAALNASFALGWKACISAEVLSRPKISIGANLYDSKLYLETPNLFAWTLTVILLSLIFEKAIKYFSRKGEVKWK